MKNDRFPGPRSSVSGRGLFLQLRVPKYRGLVLSVLHVGCLSFGAPASLLRADTVFLKDGTQILDCKVTRESDTHVSLRTPVGDMVVPRTQIFRILEQMSAYDIYEEKLAKIREGDFNGLYKLAVWCRQANGLRKEADELLARVIALKEDHVAARRLLGHIRVEREWVVPPPLELRIASKSADRYARSFREKFALFVASRPDVRVADQEPDTAPEGGSDRKGSDGEPDRDKPGAEDSLDGCDLKVSVIFSRKAASKFYGTTVGQDTFGATVKMQVESRWIGKKPLKAAVEGLVPVRGGNVAASAGIGIQNALGTNQVFVHKFLDQLIQQRSKLLQGKLVKEARKDNSDRKTGRNRAKHRQ